MGEPGLRAKLGAAKGAGRLTSGTGSNSGERGLESFIVGLGSKRESGEL